jgi:2-polyprenyl-3-methyl-5-hydroxy-6-metoxy-1,4-benzoquinol methylase
VSHAWLFGRGVRVLDVACGRGRHAYAAAEAGASVVAVDSDATALREGKKGARRHRLGIDWVRADLERDPLPPGPFDAVMIFNYLDRDRMGDFLAAVKPGGHLLAETFLEQQRTLGTGPTSDKHLLKTGELITMVQPFEVVLAREVMEVIDGHPSFLASILARRP